MASPKTSYRLEDRKSYKSGQIARNAEGEPYFYEEINYLNAFFEQTGNGLGPNPAKMVLIRNGRSVQLFISEQSFPIWNAGPNVVFTASVANGGYFIPEHLRPIVKEGETETRIPCTVTNTGGNFSPGVCIIDKTDGKMTFNIGLSTTTAPAAIEYSAQKANGSLGFPTQTMSWICDGVSNLPTTYQL